MRLPFPTSWTYLAWLSAGALALLLLVDTGSLLLTRVSTPDRVHDAGRAAAEAVEGLALTQQSAVLAYDAARSAAADHSLQIDQDDFRVLPHGRVRITATRTAPTLLLHRLPRLERYIEVSATEIVEPLPYRSAAQ